jgi:hypothetical protein
MGGWPLIMSGDCVMRSNSAMEDYLLKLIALFEILGRCWHSGSNGIENSLKESGESLDCFGRPRKMNVEQRNLAKLLLTEGKPVSEVARLSVLIPPPYTESFRQPSEKMAVNCP